ncbi:MAG TPA: SDR family oxidoreductase [Puia sp.]
MKQQKVIILGGSAGIGLATAKAAAAEGAHITIVSSNKQRIDQALQQLPAGSKGFAVDLSKEQNIKEFFDQFSSSNQAAGSDHAGSFDHLLYTAGENLSLSPIADTDIDQARSFFTIRYWGAFATVKYAAPHINPGGSIGLIGGIASPRPGKGWSVASSICAAMEGFVRAMAVELAPIRVNLVAPGVVRTDLWGLLSETDRNQLFKTVGDSLPVKRIGEAEDIAQTFTYLMKQGYCTGQVLVVDGGNVLV